MFATAIVGGGQRVVGARRAAPRPRRRSRAAFSRVASIDGASMSTPSTGREAEQRRGDREHAGAAADVEQRAALELLQQLRGRAASSGASPVPNARPGSITTASASAGGVSHGGPIQSGPTRTGWWNARQRSSQPASTSVGARAAEEVPEPLLAGRVGVRGELDALGPVDLLEALREELEHGRARLLGALGADLDRDSAQTGSAERALQLLEEALVVPVGVLVARRVELLEQAALLVGEPARHGDVDEHAVVAAAEALQHRHALAAQHAHLARLRAGRRARARPARRASRPSTVAPSAAWTIVRSTCEKMSLPSRTKRASGVTRTSDVDVAGAAAERAGVALAGDADALAVVDAGRDVDVERRATRATRPAPLALLARVLDDLAAAAAVRARLRADELAEDAARDLLQAAGCRRSAGRSSGCVPGSTPSPSQTAQVTATSNGTSTFDAARGVDELDLDLGADVGAALLRAPRRAAAEEVVAEERREEVAEAAEVEVRRREPARAEAGVAVAVVELRASRSSRAPRRPR